MTEFSENDKVLVQEVEDRFKSIGDFLRSHSNQSTNTSLIVDRFSGLNARESKKSVTYSLSCSLDIFQVRVNTFYYKDCRVKIDTFCASLLPCNDSTHFMRHQGLSLLGTSSPINGIGDYISETDALVDAHKELKHVLSWYKNNLSYIKERIDKMECYLQRILLLRKYNVLSTVVERAIKNLEDNYIFKSLDTWNYLYEYARKTKKEDAFDVANFLVRKVLVGSLPISYDSLDEYLSRNWFKYGVALDDGM